MRIAIVSNFRGGLRQFATSLSGGLQARGFETDILCPAHARIPSAHRSGENAVVYSGLSAAKRILSGRYDLIHCNIASLGVLPIISKKIRRVPIVETFHGFPQWWLEPQLVDKLAYVGEFRAVQILARAANSRTSISNFVRTTLLRVLGIDSLTVHNGINPCPIGSPSRTELRSQFGIADNTVVILFVGRLHPAKKPMTLLKAFRVLVEQGRDVKLLVVGDGPLSGAFRSEIGAFHLEKVVSIWKSLSWQQPLHSVYAAADIFCLPSVNEAFGLVLLEAMDHSLPLVVSDSGAAPEIAGPAGVTFRTGDEFDLSQKLIQLAEDGELRRRLGSAARKRFQESFELDTMINGYLRVYEETLASN